MHPCTCVEFISKEHMSVCLLGFLSRCVLFEIIHIMSWLVQSFCSGTRHRRCGDRERCRTRDVPQRGANAPGQLDRRHGHRGRHSLKSHQARGCAGGSCSHGCGGGSWPGHLGYHGSDARQGSKGGEQGCSPQFHHHGHALWSVSSTLVSVLLMFLFQLSLNLPRNLTQFRG